MDGKHVGRQGLLQFVTGFDMHDLGRVQEFGMVETAMPVGILPVVRVF